MMPQPSRTRIARITEHMCTADSSRSTGAAAARTVAAASDDQRRILYATFTATEGNEAEVSALIAGLQEKVRQEPGNLIFQATTREGEPREFVVYEEYVDEAAFQAHVTADYGAVFVRTLAPLALAILRAPHNLYSQPLEVCVVTLWWLGLGVLLVECQAQHADRG